MEVNEDYAMGIAIIIHLIRTVDLPAHKSNHLDIYVHHNLCINLQIDAIFSSHVHLSSILSLAPHISDKLVNYPRPASFLAPPTHALILQ